MIGRGLAVIVLTKDEERDLPACLASVRDIATELIVVDSWSTDGTVEIARAAGARVYQRDFVTQAEQFNWALEAVGIDAEWILRIDADERVTPELARDLERKLGAAEGDVTGFVLPLRIRFLGRDLRYGDTYPVWLLRVFRRGAGRYESLAMDEKVVLARGRADRLSGDLIHDIPKSLGAWVRKHTDYAARECQAILERQGRVDESDYGGADAGARRRKKELIYLRLPPLWRALVYWGFRYFLRLGFLDGVEGAIYHFLQGFWYRFLVDSLLLEGSWRDRTAARR